MALRLGVLLIFLRAAESSLGKNLQRYAKQPGRHMPMLNLVGIVLKVLCGPMDTVAYNLAPQMTLAPLAMSLGLLFDFVAAPRIHGDRVPPRHVVAAVVIVVGTVACLMNGARSAGVLMPAGERLAVYSVVVTAVCMLPLGVILSSRTRLCQVDALAHAALGGILGSMTLVLGKVSIRTLRTNPTVLSSAGFLAVILVVVPSHLFVLNRSFGRYSLVFLTPASGALGLLANVTTGFTLYSEVPVDPVRFAGGVALLLLGVLVLCSSETARRDGSPKASEEVCQTMHHNYGQLSAAV